MKKLLFSVLFTVTLFFSLFAASTLTSAYWHSEPVNDYNECDIRYDADIESRTATITAFEPSSGRVVIPEKIHHSYDDEDIDLSVVKIKNSNSYEKFNYIFIPQSVTEIEPYAVGYISEYIYEDDEDYDDYYDYDEDEDYYDDGEIEYIIYYGNSSSGNYTYQKIEDFTIGCIKGSVAETYAVENGFAVSYVKNISELSVSLNADSFTYNFDEIEAAVTVLDGDKALVEDVDYYLQYENNDSIGTATVKITCKGNYTGSQTLSFTINPIDVSMLTFSEIEDYMYYGLTYEPRVSITYDGEYLSEGRDYTVTYKDNNKPGTASVTFDFKGDYTGSKTITFRIYKPEVTDLKADARSDSRIMLSWESDWSIDNYYIYRYNQKKKKYVKIGEAFGSYYDEKLKANTLYKYKVYPVIKNENGDAVKGEAASVECTTLLKAPKTELTLYKNSVKIKYSKVDGADGYTFYRQRIDQLDEKEEIKTIKNGKAGSYTDKGINPNGIYSYFVSAYKLTDGKKVYGVESKEESTDNYDVILRGAKLNSRTYYTVYDTQGSTTTSYTYNLSANDINILNNFQKKHFKKNWSDAKKLQYTLSWINGEVLYALGENWTKIAGKSWVDAIFTYKMGQCAQYNGAMAAMLVYMGYDASIIKGYRGISTQHFWCEVKINDRIYVMETGNFGRNGGWSYFLLPYEYCGGYIKNKATATSPSLGPDVKSVKLSKTSYVYDGKAKKPSVKVINTEGKELQKDKDYTVVYSPGRKKTGIYCVTVTFKGKYTGKTNLFFSVSLKAPEFSLTAGKKKITVNIDEVKDATEYEIYISADKTFSDYYTTQYVNVPAGKKKVTISGLKKNKKYYVKIRSISPYSYTPDDYYYDHDTFYNWSEIKSIKTKK